MDEKLDSVAPWINLPFCSSLSFDLSSWCWERKVVTKATGCADSRISARIWSETSPFDEAALRLEGEVEKVRLAPTIRQDAAHRVAVIRNASRVTLDVVAIVATAATEGNAISSLRLSFASSSVENEVGDEGTVEL